MSEPSKRTMLARWEQARLEYHEAKALYDQRVEGLMLGADDYMAKPFAMVELSARLRALGRRASRPRDSE